MVLGDREGGKDDKWWLTSGKVPLEKTLVEGK